MDRLVTFQVGSNVIAGVQSLQVTPELAVDALEPFGGAPMRGGSLAEDMLVIPGLSTVNVEAQVVLSQNTFISHLLSTSETHAWKDVMGNNGLLGEDVTVRGAESTLTMTDTRITRVGFNWDDAGLLIANIGYMGIVPVLTHVPGGYAVPGTDIAPITKDLATSLSIASANSLGLGVSTLKNVESFSFETNLGFITRSRYLSKRPYLFLRYPIIQEGVVNLLVPERGTVNYDLQDIGYARQSLKGSVTLTLTGASYGFTLGLKNAAIESAPMQDNFPAARPRFSLRFRAYCYSDTATSEHLYLEQGTP